MTLAGARRELAVVCAAGTVEGIVLVTVPAASTVFTSQYGLSGTRYAMLFLPQVLRAAAADDQPRAARHLAAGDDRGLVGGVIVTYQAGYGVAAIGVGPLRASGVPLSQVYAFAALLATGPGVAVLCGHPLTRSVDLCISRSARAMAVLAAKVDRMVSSNESASPMRSCCTSSMPCSEKSAHATDWILPPARGEVHTRKIHYGRRVGVPGDPYRFITVDLPKNLPARHTRGSRCAVLTRGRACRDGRLSCHADF